MLVKGIIEQALRAQNMESAAAMIDRSMVVRSFDDIREFCSLRNWLERLDDEVLSHYPMLCLYYAQVYTVSMAPELPPDAMLKRIDRLLQMADSVWRSEENVSRLGEVYAFRAQLAMRQDRQEEMVAYASQALRWLPLESQHWRGVCLNLLGVRALSSGQLEQSVALLREALTIWANLRHPHGARSCLLSLATVYREQGVLQHAEACYRRVIQDARVVGDREDLIPALLGLAQTLYEWGDTEAAEHVAQEAWDESEQWRNRELLLRTTSMLLRVWSLYLPQVLVRQRLVALQGRISPRSDLFSSLQPLLQKFELDREVSEGRTANVESLTQQEQRVLRLLVAELAYADIARELVVSVNTVKTQVNSIYRKLNVHSRREVRVAAKRLQL